MAAAEPYPIIAAGILARRDRQKKERAITMGDVKGEWCAGHDLVCGSISANIGSFAPAGWEALPDHFRVGDNPGPK